ncbi:hypothetical protein Tcan_01099, partial [Toxocara canis]
WACIVAEVTNNSTGKRQSQLSELVKGADDEPSKFLFFVIDGIIYIASVTSIGYFLTELCSSCAYPFIYSLSSRAYHKRRWPHISMIGFVHRVFVNKDSLSLCPRFWSSSTQSVSLVARLLSTVRAISRADSCLQI